MKVLILGAGGMLGHKMYQVLSSQYKDVYTLFRKDKAHYSQFNLYNEKNMIDNFDVMDNTKFLSLLDDLKPDVIVNCIGKTTRKINKDAYDSVIYLNSYLPHLISRWSKVNNSYFINISTDCVFSGKNGPYKINDVKDSRDIYGLSKAIGETETSHGLTIRTSIVGRELENKTEFFEWIFSCKDQSAFGYKNVFYSGVTTLFLSQTVAHLLQQNKKVTGIVQLGSEPISKLELIKKINLIFNLNINITANFEKVSNKILKCIDFQFKTGMKQPSWDEMLKAFKIDNEFYENINAVGDKAS